MPDNVLLVMNRRLLSREPIGAGSSTPPPDEVAWLSESVVSRRVIGPAYEPMRMPPPLPALLPDTTLAVIVTSPPK